MYYEISYDKADTWLSCHISGEIGDIPGVEGFVNDASCFLNRYPDCRHILCDATEAAFSLSLAQIWQVPKIITKIARSSLRYDNGNSRTTKRALVVSRQLKDRQFFTTVTSNLGRSVRVFTDMEEAKRWLAE